MRRTEEQEEMERSAREMIARFPHYRDKEAIRRGRTISSPLGVWADPQYHPEISRVAMGAGVNSGSPDEVLMKRDAPYANHRDLVAAIQRAMRPGPAAAQVFSPAAFEIWDAHARSRASLHPPSIQIGEEAEMPAGWVCMRDQYATSMLLACGGPIAIATGAHGLRVACVSEGYAADRLCYHDISYRPQHAGTAALHTGLVACFRNILRRVADDAGLADTLRGMFLGAATPIVRLMDDPEPIIYLAADMTATAILADWVEEKVDADIARNLRMLLDWLAEFNGGPDAKGAGP